MLPLASALTSPALQPSLQGGCGTRRGPHQVWKQGLGLSCPSEMPPLLSGRYKAGGTTSLLLL